MLKSLVKKLSPKEAVQMDNVTDNVELNTELATQLATAQESLVSMTAQFEAVSAELSTVAEKFKEVESQLAALVAEKTQLIETAKDKALAVRKEKIVAAIGTEKSDALMAATAGLDDASFESVVGALAGSVEAEAKTTLFVEVGASAEADATAVQQDTSLDIMSLIKNKYQIK